LTYIKVGLNEICAETRGKKRFYKKSHKINPYRFEFLGNSLTFADPKTGLATFIHIQEARKVRVARLFETVA